jgi:ubiquinone biosynthesis protein
MDRKKENERMREIVSVFVRHGIGKGMRSSNMPVSIRESFEELGSTFIKIGQILSMRPDLLPEAYIVEFQRFQDSVRPEDFDSIRKAAEKELKMTLEQVFSEFEVSPVASASLAQVHLARLKDGTRVAVKVLRPGVRETMLRDIAIMKRLARRIRFLDRDNIVNFEDIADELENSTRKELDFMQEARNIWTFREYNSSVKYITCPAVYDEYTTPGLLVMSYIEGIKITDTGRLEEEGYDTADISRKLADNYFKQIFEDGFFHADPHPGNIFIKENKIAYLDFGMTGTLSTSMKDKFNSFLFGIVSRDVNEMARSVLKICVQKGEIDIGQFHSDIDEMYSKYVEMSLQEVELKHLIHDLYGVLRRNRLSMPRDYAMLIRGVLTMEGLLERIAPEVNIFDMAMPYVRRQMLGDTDFRKEIKEQLENLYILLRSSPKIMWNVSRFVSDVMAGKMRIQEEKSMSAKMSAQVNRLVNRAILGIVAAALIIGSALAASAASVGGASGMPAISLIGYAAALVIGIYLVRTRNM